MYPKAPVMMDEEIVMTEVALPLFENSATQARMQAKRMKTAAHAELVMFFMA